MPPSIRIVEIAGYFSAIVIGITLGLIGSGGSILTVPVLVYLFGVEASLATVYSLFVVGSTSLLGSANYFLKKQTDLRTVLVFGIPSVVAVFVTRRYLLSIIPDQIFTVGHFIMTKNMMLLLLFALLMIASSYSMIKKRNMDTHPTDVSINYPILFGQGILTGIITGLIGAGGGFLIIPALVNFMGMPIKKAVGTSLLIIALNSLVGFAFSAQDYLIRWNFLLGFTALAGGGILIGSYLSNRIDGKKLKPAFGWFVLVMGIYIIIKETIFK